MTAYKEKPFYEEEVLLDGNQFENCSFNNVRFVFTGSAPCQLVGCKIDGFTIEFRGSAELTMKFLQTIYHGMGPVGQDIFNKTIENLKQPPNS